MQKVTVNPAVQEVRICGVIGLKGPYINGSMYVILSCNITMFWLIIYMIIDM